MCNHLFAHAPARRDLLVAAQQAGLEFFFGGETPPDDLGVGVPPGSIRASFTCDALASPDGYTCYSTGYFTLEHCSR
jgi:hypothetical protein